MFGTSIASLWLPLSQVSLRYWYYKNTVLRFCDIVWFLIILFSSLYPFTLHQHTVTNNSTIFLVIANDTGEFTILILQKYGFKFCMISFGFYLSRFKVYIRLPCINTQRRTTATFFCGRHCHGWVYYIDTTKIHFKGLCDIAWFLFVSC